MRPRDARGESILNFVLIVTVAGLALGRLGAVLAPEPEEEPRSVCVSVRGESMTGETVDVMPVRLIRQYEARC